MDNRDDLDKYFSHITGSLFNHYDYEYPDIFKNAYLAGDNVLYQKNISETKIFDDEWIKTIESYFPSIDKITRNPRSHIKYDREVVEIEKSKKTTSESIRHLASHTQFVREVNSDQTVKPSKILNITSDVDFDVYENRFIATLINRLFLFVRSRLEVIRNNVESFQKDHFAVNSKFDIFDDEVEFKMDLIVKRDLDNKTINEKNYQLLERVENLSKLIDSLKGSQFMQIMKKSNPVYPPIMKTNVILKNPDFKNAYTLWLYMDKFNSLGYDVNVGEKNLELDSKFRKYIDELVLVNYTTILANQLNREHKYNTVDYDMHMLKRKKTNSKVDFDIVDNPDNVDIEDNTLNEYFLNKYKKLFDQSVQELEATGEVRHDDALKRALRKATDIVNGLFESIFRLEEDNDIFRRLVDKEDINKDYENKKNQLKYAKMIREIKQVDFNKMIRLERKLVKDLQKINTKFIKEKMLEKANADKPSAIAEMEVEVKRLRTQNEEYAQRLAKLENLDELNSTEISTLKASREEALTQAKTEIKAFEQELKRKQAEEKAAIRKEFRSQQKELERNAVREEKAFNDRKENLERLLTTQHQKEMDKLAKDKADLEKKYNAMVEREKVQREKELEALKKREERKRENEEQKERERIAIMKVKAYEEKMKALSKVNKIKEDIANMNN